MTRRLSTMSRHPRGPRLGYRPRRSPARALSPAANRCRPLPTLVLVLRSAVLAAGLRYRQRRTRGKEQSAGNAKEPSALTRRQPRDRLNPGLSQHASSPASQSRTPGGQPEACT